MRRSRALLLLLSAAAAACITRVPRMGADIGLCEPAKLAPNWTALAPVYRSCEVDREAVLVGKAPELKWQPPSNAPRCNTAVAEFVVDPTGVPEQAHARLASAMDPTLGLALMKSVPFWRYTPAVKNGQAVRQAVRAPIIVWASAKMVARTAQDSLCKF